MQHLITDVFNQSARGQHQHQDGLAGRQFHPRWHDGHSQVCGQFDVADDHPGTRQRSDEQVGFRQWPDRPGPHARASPRRSSPAQTAFFVAEEFPASTNVSDLDQINFKVGFTDVNVGDRPTAAADFTSFTYKDVHGNDVTASLSALQQADIAATETALTLTPELGQHQQRLRRCPLQSCRQEFRLSRGRREVTLTYTITVEHQLRTRPGSHQRTGHVHDHRHQRHAGHRH